MQKNSQNLTKEYITEIEKKMFIKTQIKPADLLIVFGTTYGVDLFVENIVNLYNNGYCRYILCTGGNEVTYDEKKYIESMLLKELLIKNNVPEDVIFIEDKSKNTGENLQFSISILQKAFGEINNIKGIIGVGKIHATLRFLMTMCKYLSLSEKMFFPINVFGCDEKYWYLNDNFARKLMLEFGKIDEYLEKGFIAELDDKVLILE